MVERWAGLAVQQDICGCHVHVGVPDLETAVAVMDRARPYLPVLLAMTGSSPFHDGVDTGYDSYRTLWWSRWPNTGPPEYLGSAERFEEVVAGTGRVRGDRGPVAPVLGRAALLSPARRWSSGSPTSAPTSTTPSCTRRSSGRWCACWPPGPSGASRARSRARSCSGRRAGGPPGTASAGSCSTRCWAQLVDARLAVRRLLAELEDDLRGRDEWTEVSELVARLFARGTSAARQRQIWLRTGDRREVAAQDRRAASSARRTAESGGLAPGHRPRPPGPTS